MKRRLVVGTLIGILFALGPPAMATKFTFDLSKGPVSFSYSTIGAYNPIRITITGETGIARTWLASAYYQSQTLLQAVNKLLMTQHGAVPWMDLSVESLIGKLSFLASTQDGEKCNLEMEGKGSITVRLETSGMGTDTSEKEISAVVQVNVEAGRLTIEDSSPKPDSASLVSEKYGVPPGQMSQLLDQFGRSRVMNALETAGNHNGIALAQNGAVAGGAASIPADGSVSLSDLSPGEVFRISLWGLKYQGYLRDSTLYMRLLHPANGVSIRDMRVILTVVELEPPEPLHGPHIVLWDVFPYDYQAGCYLYHLNSTGWRPGAYEVYIDVGKIVNFKLPITITDWHQVVARRG